MRKWRRKHEDFVGDNYWQEYGKYIEENHGRAFVFYSMPYDGGQVELFAYPMGKDDDWDDWPENLGPYQKEKFW